MSIEAMKQARQIIWRYRHETPLGNQPHMIAHLADEMIERIDQALAKQEQSEPVGMAQVYRCRIKSRKQIDREIPREKQGWWADISAGQLIRLREATQADVDRCTLNGTHSKDPADYMCETHTNGSLVSKDALEYMNPEQNVFTSTTPQQRKPLTDEMAKQMKERCDSMEMRGAFADGWLSAEAAHGIKD